nr:winged helix-turn-helix domain-containing protein [Vibrio sp. Isolate33]
MLRQFVREDGHVETIAPLEGKVFLFLLENAGECIERGLIFDRCWGNVIVSEQALTNVISKIRKTLSRVTCGCATIRTVSKTGYSLEINESIKPSEAEVVSCPVTTEGVESNPSSVAQEALLATETSTDANKTTTSDSELNISSNQEQSSVELEPSNSKSKAHLIKAGYLVALICVLVTAFNLFQTYYAPMPYFVDKTEYRDSYTDNTNQYFFHIVHDEGYSLPAITQKLTDVLPSHCNVDVFVRIYPSVDQPENDALYMLVQRKDGEALNYGATIFNVDTSFDSFAAHMEKRSYFCD